MPLIRFDAFAYASKRPGTSCFFVEPNIWDVLEIGMRPLLESGTEMLPEIHENYHYQMKMAERGYWVYDFALPMLLLHGLMTGRTDRLIHWLNICPRKQFTALDTHDGIGVVDVADLLTDEEIELVRDRVDQIILPAEPYLRFPGMVKESNGKTARHQLPCTYYSARELMTTPICWPERFSSSPPACPRCIMWGCWPEKTTSKRSSWGEEPRSINRHTFSEEEIRRAVERPMLRRMYDLMRFRNTHPAFNGEIVIGPDAGDGRLTILHRKGGDWAELNADFVNKRFTVRYTDLFTQAEKTF